jgi:hypothetical protein
MAGLGTVSRALSDDQVLRAQRGDPDATYLNPYRLGDGLWFEKQGTENDLCVQVGGRRPKAMWSSILFK